MFRMDYIPNKQLNLSDFQEYRFVIDDIYNKIPDGNVWLLYFDKNTDGEYIDKMNKVGKMAEFYHLIKTRNDIEKLACKSIAYVSYKLETGQIGLIYVKPKYQNAGIGKQIVLKVINDPYINFKPVFTITAKNHPFWSNVFNKSFEYSKRPHMSLTGDGYVLNLDKFQISNYQ
jgi:GNAT superfamily N-acetyltransferase